MYHHLHCLKIIRHYIALDHYPDDVDAEMYVIEPGHVYPEHIEHCIEALRLYLICQPDITVSVLARRWRNPRRPTRLIDY